MLDYQKQYSNNSSINNDNKNNDNKNVIEVKELYNRTMFFHVLSVKIPPRIMKEKKVYLNNFLQHPTLCSF